jgi:hypothetical protein
VVFEWDPNFTPAAGQAFELIFWKAGQDPMAAGFGLAAPTTNNSVSADMESLDSVLGDLLEPGPYRWGVLLVEEDPYQRLDFLGGGWTFNFTRSGGGSSGGGSSGESSGE